MKISTKKHLNSVFIIFIFMCFCISGYAQNNSEDNHQKPKSEFWKKVRFGGGIGLGFGNGYFNASLAPQAIYQANKTVGIGIGLSGTISNRKNYFNSTILGGSIISTFNIIPELQASAEFEQLNIDRNFKGQFSGRTDDNYWTQALFLGAGYRVANTVIGLRYNVLHDDDRSVYRDAIMPFVRVMF